MIDLPTGKLRPAVFIFVESNPGCTSTDVMAGLPNEKRLSVGSTLSHLHRDGFLSRKKRGRMYHYSVAEPVAPQPLSDWERDRFRRMQSELPEVEMQLRRAENELFEATERLAAEQEVHAEETKRLQARIHHLEQWRDAAIARYPDLDVDPALLAKAREIVMRASDITTADADEILAGEWDHTPIMRATLEALGSSVL